MAACFRAVHVFWLLITTLPLFVTTDDEMMCDYRKMVNVETKVTEWIMDCQRLHFQTIPKFEKRRKIDTLLLGSNLIREVPDKAFEGISPRTIDLHGNTIEKVDGNAFAGQADSLKTLNLSVNSLSLAKLDWTSKLKSLEILDLHYNNYQEKVSLKKGVFKGLTSLKKLYLAKNGIRSLNRTFQGLSELRYLDLKNNKLNSLGHSLGGLEKLVTLDVSSNNLRHFPKEDVKDLPNLKELNLNGNRIKKIPDNAFGKVKSLEKLFLGSNNIKGIEALNAPAFGPLADTLKVLELSKCNLDKTPNDLLKVVSNLETLDLSMNKFGEAPEGTFASLKKLKVLKLGSNPLTLSPGIFRGLENTLGEIYLEDLRLKALPSDLLSPLKALERIVISSNDLTEIPDDSVKQLSAMIFDFSKNDISKISEKAFSQTTGPVDVDLSSNKLKNLDFAADGCKFSFLDVSDNPITCGCSVLELVRHADLEISGTCSAPPEFNNFEISSPEFYEKSSDVCNQTNPELVYCNTVKPASPANSSPRELMSLATTLLSVVFILVLTEASVLR